MVFERLPRPENRIERMNGFKNSDMYKRDGKTTVAIKGVYDGRDFMIGRGIFGQPVAYIRLNRKYIEWNGSDYSDYRGDAVPVCVHGGVTYYGQNYWDQKKDGYAWFGWDYAHCGDYDPPCFEDDPEDDGHKWSLAELLMQVGSAIGQLNSYIPNDEDDWQQDKDDSGV